MGEAYSTYVRIKSKLLTAVNYVPGPYPNCDWYKRSDFGGYNKKCDWLSCGLHVANIAYCGGIEGKKLGFRSD